MILLDASLRISVVAVMAALILTVMRVRASGVRHAVWTVVLAAMLLMPILPSIVPSDTVLSPARAAVVLPSTFVLPDIWTDPVRPAVIHQDTPTAKPVPSARVQSSDFDRSQVPLKSPWSIWPLMSAAYVIGAILLLLRLIVGWRAVARLTHCASPVPLACKAPVRESELLATPLTAGVLAPTIILPDGWAEWPAEKLRACLAHELAHIQRRDPLVAFIAHLNRCVFWFHPLAWWLERTLPPRMLPTKRRCA